MATIRTRSAQSTAFVYTCPYCGTQSNASLCPRRECRRKHYAEIERRRSEERAKEKTGDGRHEPSAKVRGASGR